MKEGDRVGRFVILRDTSGALHAVAATAISALCATDDGVVLLLPGGRMLALQQDLPMVLAWFEVR